MPVPQPLQPPIDRSSSRFKRAPPPTFNGDRSEWPEFRTIWRRYGAQEFPNDEERAWAFKGCLKGKAHELVKAVYATQPNAYQRMWDRLENTYSDISPTVQCAFTNLDTIKQVKAEDLQGLVHFVNEVNTII